MATPIVNNLANFKESAMYLRSPKMKKNISKGGAASVLSFTFHRKVKNDQ